MKLTYSVHELVHGSPEYQDLVALRRAILRLPLGLDFTDEQLAAEATDIHLGAYHGHGQLVGGLILTPLSPSTLKMRQVAVAESAQHAGVGTALVRRSEELARGLGYHTLVLNARDTAVPFYLKLGYALVGELFVEVGIPHRSMQKHL